uniref:UPS1 n=1 Tax=Stygiella incarcerata TaxID=1712417 RepID=A0A192ZI64_9EUKA|nr:UPS1 [Stygiella incarcerata]
MHPFERKHVYSYPWESVSEMHWRKYPSIKNRDVLDVCLLDKVVDPSKGTLFARRLFTCDAAIPWFLSKLVPRVSPYLYAIETIEVNPLEKTMRVTSRNLNFRNIMSVQESSSFTPDPEAPFERTLFKQRARIIVHAPSWVRGKAENWSGRRWATNSKIGVDMMEELCRNTFVQKGRQSSKRPFFT